MDYRPDFLPDNALSWILGVTRKTKDEICVDSQGAKAETKDMREVDSKYYVRWRIKLPNGYIVSNVRYISSEEHLQILKKIEENYFGTIS